MVTVCSCLCLTNKSTPILLVSQGSDLYLYWQHSGENKTDKSYIKRVNLGIDLVNLRKGIINRENNGAIFEIFCPVRILIQCGAESPKIFIVWDVKKSFHLC